VVALDPNHKNLVYGTSNMKEAFEIANPWFLKKLDRSIAPVKWWGAG
jgi:hypothetical protein